MADTQNTRRSSVKEFNDFIVCKICNGYIIEPTTVDYCHHTYCRSCIVKHLAEDPYCPQCKSLYGKQIDKSNLQSDQVVRSIIYKIVPGLYQRVCNEQRSHKHEELFKKEKEGQEDKKPNEISEETGLEFFSPTEPISLSLALHPTHAKHWSDAQKPPVRYLQCPASVKIHHLKRLLCSKFDIHPDNELIEIEVMYEDDILPNDFSLMDVGYCFNWRRHSPMAFYYRILVYDNAEKKKEHQKSKDENKQATKASIVKLDKSNGAAASTSAKSNSHTKSVTFALDENLKKSENKTMMMNTTMGSSDSSSCSSNDGDAGVGDSKILTTGSSRKNAEGKKSSGKRVVWNENSLAINNNDFKSLRSNDVRYSDYGSVSRTMNAVEATTKTTSQKSKAGSNYVGKRKKCDIVVSIPQSQLSNSSYTEDEDFELKTANKKSNVPKNLPKLKIELASMKTKLMKVPKPKSADARLEETTNAGRLTKRRKSIVEEAATAAALPTLASQLDLETYAKNIGLKPRDNTMMPVESSSEKTKISPSATSSSSSSPNGPFSMGTNTTATVIGDVMNASLSSSSSSSSHKKRKKKHSKDSNGKRKKLHAEISSQTDGKMKVKITSSCSTHKLHKLELKRSHSVGGSSSSSERFSSGTTTSSGGGVVEQESSVALNKIKLLETVATSANECENLKALNRTLGEEARSINSLMHSSSMSLLSSSSPPSLKSESDKQLDDCDTNENANCKTKSVESGNEFKHTSSPPLPPSLFKTTAMAFAALQTPPSTPSPTSSPSSSSNSDGSKLTASAQLKGAGNTLKPTTEWTRPQSSVSKSPTAINIRLPTHSPSAPSVAHFAVPNPPRPIDGHPMQRYFSTPSSIASSANKNANLLIKRSLSLDEQRTNFAKQQRFEHDRYGTMVQRKPVAAPPAKCPKSLASKTAFGPDVSQSISMAHTAITSGSVTITAHPRISTGQSQHTQSQMDNFTLPYAGGMLGTAAYNKPALEIVRITSNQLPTDKQPLPSQNSQSSNRLMGPPIGFVKPKKPQMQAQVSTSPSAPVSTQTTITQSTTPTIVKSPPLHLPASYLSSANSAYRASLPALINIRNTMPFPFPSKSSTSTSIGAAAAAGPSPSSSSSISFGEVNSKRPAASTVVPSSAFVAAAVALAASAAAAGCGSKANGTALSDRSKTSLRDFRPSCKDGSVDILDLSASRNTETKPKQEATAKNADLATNTSTNASATTRTTSTSAVTVTETTTTTNTTTRQKSLSPTTAAAMVAPAKPQSFATNSLEAALNKIKQNISASNLSVAGSGGGGGSSSNSSLESASEDLQNLHMLSESATAREKITIKSSNIFNAKPKPQPSTMVRQQNASVRNIPNPSALAFRNQTTLPTIAKSTGNVVVVSSISSSITGNSILTSSRGTTNSSPITVSSSSIGTITNNNNNNNSINNINNSSLPQAAISPRATKKVTTIDQVAANLNIRAAAAEASAARNTNNNDSEQQVSGSGTHANRKATTTETTKHNVVATSVVPVTTLSETKAAAKSSVVNISAKDTLTTVASSA